MRLNVLVAIIASLLFLSGCVSSNKNYGTLTQSRGVEKSFKSFQIPDGYNYYYAGTATVPDAIIGVKDGFVMAESQFWKPVDLDEEQMREWWSWMKDTWFSGLGLSYERVVSMGWVVISPDGREAAIMYAKYSRVTTVFPQPNVISVSVPRPRNERYMWRRDRD